MNIAILGSTGSIGKTLLDIIYKENQKINIKLLTANKNYLTILKQAKKFNVKNIIITDNESYIKAKKKNKNFNLKIYNNYESFHKIFKKKIDYVMSSIIGLSGLVPTLNIIKFTKKIAIANKESIICGWDLIKKELNKNKTKFIPIDSEHFSIWSVLNNNNLKIDKIFITASGGPFLKKTQKKIKFVNIEDAINHPNWKMGKKISIDSSTMMNKVFEVMETNKIFNIPLNKISILIHPSSYIHAIVKFSNGIIKIIAHDTSMKIPIFNSLYYGKNKNFISKQLNINLLNQLNFSKIDNNQFKSVKLLTYLPNSSSLFETILVVLNDEFVNMYLNKKIHYYEIVKNILKYSKIKEFQKYKKLKVKKLQDIIELAKNVRIKINSLDI